MLMMKPYAEAMAGRGSADPSGRPTPNSGRLPLATDQHDTVRIHKLQSTGPAIIPGDVLTAIKNQGVDSLYLQRQSTGDYLLTVAHVEKKRSYYSLEQSTTKMWPTG